MTRIYLAKRRSSVVPLEPSRPTPLTVCSSRAARRPRLLICSHTGFVEDGHTAIERKITYWEDLLEQVRPLRENGLPTEAIPQALLGPEGLAIRVSRGHFSKRNLISSLLNGTA